MASQSSSQIVVISRELADEIDRALTRSALRGNRACPRTRTTSKLLEVA